MSNLSKIKRDRMIKFLETLKAQHTDDESIRAFTEIENQLRDKKYGLVWEEHSEKVDELLKDNIPVFTEDVDRKIVSDKSLPYNFILEGDNLQSLYLLEKTHKGRIDVIYIDPPYNTANSLTYDDKRIDENDNYRHSKWISFMNERLKLAHKLLASTGVLFVSIDDNEGYALKLLLDEIFFEQNCMGVMSVIKEESGILAKQKVKGHDLLFVYAKDINHVKPLAREKDIRGKRFTKNGIEYWIQEDAIRAEFGTYGNLYYEDIIDKKGPEFKEKIDLGIKKGEYILVPKNNGKTIIGKIRRVDEDYSKFYTVIKHLNAGGIETLKTMGLADKFDYPKPVSLVKYLIKGATFFDNGHPPIILDFFAGSGTTGQAVLELNNEDGKRRNFILCTNNEVSAKQKIHFVQEFGFLNDYEPKVNTTDSAIENKIYQVLGSNNAFNDLVQNNKEKYELYGICQSVTYPRISNIINGYISKIPYSKVLYEKKLTKGNYYNGHEYKKIIDNIILQQEYQNYNLKLSDNNIVLTGTTKEHFKYNGIPANLKYFKCSWTPRKPKDYMLTPVLCQHVKEMIELQNAIEVDNIKNVLILNKDDFKNTILNKEIYKKIENIWVNQNIIFNLDELSLLKTKKFTYIPKEFFGLELKEAAE